MKFKQLLLTTLCICCFSAFAKTHSFKDSSIYISRDSSSYEEKNRDFEVKIRGDVESITYSSNFDLITFLPPGSNIKIKTKDKNGDRVRISIDAHPSEGAVYQLYRKTKSKGEKQAKELFSSISQEFFRHTTFAAVARSQHLHQQGGSERLYSELEHLAKGSVTIAYLQYWVSNFSFDKDELTGIIEKSKTIRSDNGLRKLLIALSENQQLNTHHYNQILEVSREIDSDSELGVLYTFLSEQSMESGISNKLIRYSGESIGSDAVLADTLKSIASSANFDSDNWNTWLTAASNIDSDFQLSTLIQESPSVQDQELIIQLIDLVQSEIQSNSLLAATLIHISKSFSVEGSSETALLNAAKTINSERERTRVLLALNE